jgi:D-inositol-3-phosphate glycosyltransferase
VPDDGFSARRLAIVGPVEPFRSGVARHTTALARALSRRAETSVRVYSFSRQYPAILFPGDSDRASDCRAPTDLDVTYSIDSINPLTWLSTARQLRAFRPDLLVMPLWTFFLAPCSSALLTSVGCANIAVVHNVADHDSSRLRAALSTFAIHRADSFITHTGELAAGIRRIVPEARVSVHPHPVFDYPAPRGVLPRRAELELLMFGLIRPYKGLDVLLEALARCGRSSVMLSVVGESWESESELRALIARLGIDGKVELVLRYVSDAEAAEYFARADVVVLPYRSVTGSGVLPLAFFYGKPVAASDLPGFREMIRDERDGWLVPAGDAVALARVIDDKLSSDAAAAMAPEVQAARQRLSFDHFAGALLQAAGQGGTNRPVWARAAG